MDIRSILVVIDGGTHSELSLEVAISMGKFFTAHVEVLHVQAHTHVVASSFAGSDPIVVPSEYLQEQIAERASHAEKMFQVHCVDAGVTVLDVDEEHSEQSQTTVTWRKVIGHEDQEIARLGRVSDLIVMAFPDKQSGGVDASALETALFDTGKPVMVFNETFSEFSGDTITIAWDGSREAAHSVGLAIPFLKRATTIRILTVIDPENDNNPNELTRFLAFHGLHAEFYARVKGERSIAEVLMDEAEGWKSSLVVMGAYGHHLVWESLVGGVTRDVLAKSKVPVFLAH